MSKMQKEICDIYANGDEIVYAEQTISLLNKPLFRRVILYIDEADFRIEAMHSKVKAWYTAVPQWHVGVINH